MSPTLPLTASLSQMAAEQGVDLTPLATAELAFNEMLQAAIARDDAAFESARVRFEAVTGNARRAQ